MTIKVSSITVKYSTRKIIATIFMVAFCYLSTNAQFTVGASGGFTVTNYSNAITFGARSNAGITPSLGITAIYKVRKSIDLQTGLFYQQIAYKNSDLQASDAMGFDLGTINKHTLNYLYVPVLVNGIFPVNKHTSFIAGIGPSWYLFLNDKMTIEQLAGSPTASGDVVITGTRAPSKSLIGAILQLGVRHKQIGAAFIAQKNFTTIHKNINNIGLNWKYFGLGLQCTYFFKK